MENDLSNLRTVDVVINYYNPKKLDILYYQTLNCVFRYIECNTNVIVSDGSGFRNELLASLAEEKNFIYLWSQEPLSFAEGYNQGIEFSLNNIHSAYVCLSANDIFVDRLCISIMLKTLLSDENIGCVIPYLSFSDYPIEPI